MMRPARLAAEILALLFVCLTTAGAIAAPPQPPAQKTMKAELFAVVQVGEEIKVVKKSELITLQKATKEEDNRRQRAYEDSKKNKGKGKGTGMDAGMGPGMGAGMGPGMGAGMGRGADGEMVKPTKRTVKTLKNSLKTEQDAKEWKEKFLDEKGDTKGGSKKTDAW